MLSISLVSASPPVPHQAEWLPGRPRHFIVLRGFSLPAFCSGCQYSERQRECAVAQGDIETYYEDGQWKNKREGTTRAFGAGYSTKDEAAAVGRDAAQADKVEHVIKNQDGQIGSKNSYGNDPRNVPG
jgi:hypothetical protein